MTITRDSRKSCPEMHDFFHAMFFCGIFPCAGAGGGDIVAPLLSIFELGENYG
jgi:hypothetical protein